MTHIEMGYSTISVGLRALLGAVLIGLFWMSGASADSAGDFYKGKTIVVLVGYLPLSDYTSYGQLLARTLGEHIPGRPSVTVRNLPGVVGVKAANYLYNAVPKDGTSIGIISIGAMIEQLFGQSKTNVDATRFGWVGSMNKSVGTCAVSAQSGIKTFDDLTKNETLFGSTDATADATKAALALTRLFGAKLKLIKGYVNAEDSVLAMDHDEVQGACGITLTVLKNKLSQHLASGRIKLILHDRRKPQPELPGVSSIYDLAKTDQDRAVLDLLFGWRALDRTVAAPPGVPPDRLRAMQQAFLDTMKDPRFLAEAEKAKLAVAPTSGEDVATLVQRLFSHSKETIARAAAAVRN